MGVLTAAEIVVHLIADEFGGERLGAIVDLAFTYPEFAIATKRAQDRDLPFWLLAIFFGASAVLDLIDVLGWGGTDQNPSVISLVLAVPFAVLFVALLVELGFRRG